MKTVGIIAEYNPFTLGHKYHLAACGESRRIAVMSGNFVQRGEPAFFDKHTRAAAAVKNGVDLVIELPVSYSIASAEKFAYGSVFILNALGICDELCFGSETADMGVLEYTAYAASNIAPDEIKAKLREGVSFARARAEVLREKEVFIPEKPNDILAVEYLKALKKTGSTMKPRAILRKGPYHGTGKGFYGASAVRELFNSENRFSAAKHVPENVFENIQNLYEKGQAPANIKNAERAVLYFLRTASAKTLSSFYGINEGLEFRIKKAADESVSIEELYERIKSKRYTMSAVKRAVLACFLQIRKNDLDPPYIRVLAQNKTGTEILKQAKKTATLPIVHRFAKIAQEDPFAEEEIRASNLYALCLPQIQKSFSDLMNKNEIII